MKTINCPSCSNDNEYYPIELEQHMANFHPGTGKVEAKEEITCFVCGQVEGAESFPCPECNVVSGKVEAKEAEPKQELLGRPKAKRNPTPY